MYKTTEKLTEQRREIKLASSAKSNFHAFESSNITVAHVEFVNVHVKTAKVRYLSHLSSIHVKRT